MRILGIDPGYAIIGYAIIEGNGNQLRPIYYNHISTSAKLTFFERMKQINTEIKEIIITHAPEVLSIEKIFFSKNKTTAINVAQVRGAIIQEAINSNLEIFEYTPNEIKIAVTGYGQAPKMQVQQMIKSLFNLKEIPKPDDTADALAIALCHFHSAKFSSIKRRMQDV
ncbi:MAG: crossover junction endodeoxyribonuclease RuvC [Candidatus Margulisbacteria bacterium GWF2_35_9]|nr:MAG: crossover junction endodeoxyribonuclease RuvC [Candidatus Margulisbacteria bacterium GWF2_35_9]